MAVDELKINKKEQMNKVKQRQKHVQDQYDRTLCIILAVSKSDELPDIFHCPKEKTTNLTTKLEQLDEILENGPNVTNDPDYSETEPGFSRLYSSQLAPNDDCKKNGRIYSSEYRRIESKEKTHSWTQRKAFKKDIIRQFVHKYQSISKLGVIIFLQFLITLEHGYGNKDFFKNLSKHVPGFKAENFNKGKAARIKTRKEIREKMVKFLMKKKRYLLGPASKGFVNDLFNSNKDYVSELIKPMSFLAGSKKNKIKTIGYGFRWVKMLKDELYDSPSAGSTSPKKVKRVLQKPGLDVTCETLRKEIREIQNLVEILL